MDLEEANLDGYSSGLIELLPTWRGRTLLSSGMIWTHSERTLAARPVLMGSPQSSDGIWDRLRLGEMAVSSVLLQRDARFSALPVRMTSQERAPLDRAGADSGKQLPS